VQYEIDSGNIFSLAATSPARSDAHECLLTGEKSERGSARTIQKDMAETQIDPIPKQ
jgi:hypothetical protein